MSKNPPSYDYDPAIAEAYDRFEAQTDDVALLRRLIGGRGALRILEPFCGTGRILLPLAQDGHEMTGLDISAGMLACAEAKTDQLPPEVRARISLFVADATEGHWPTGFDLVILGGNCFYELADAGEQEGCIAAAAAAALVPGGHVYIDNDHMEGPLPETWTRPGKRKSKWPSGTLADGTVLEGHTENLQCDAAARIWRARRTIVLRHSDGRSETHAYLQQKHPVSHGEVATWLVRHGFTIEQEFGDRKGNPYTDTAGRAIFWARLRSEEQSMNGRG